MKNSVAVGSLFFLTAWAILGSLWVPASAYAFSSRRVQAPLAPGELHQAFMDPAVSDREILSRLGRRVPTDRLKTLLTSMQKTTAPAFFTQTGVLTHFDLNPKAYDNRHAINYYVPTTYVPDGNAPVLIIMHGGGGTTRTYESSRQVSQMYLGDFIPFAEKNGVVLVGPSSSLGWSYNTRILLSETIELLKRDLPVDTDRLVLWGHSMGAMGITRESHWVIDELSAIMSDAGGMQDEYRTEALLLTYFDTRFIHAQGLYDHFQDFVTRTRDVEQKMKALEVTAGEESGYEAHFQPRGHNMDLGWIFEKLESDVLQSRRDIYQRGLNPLLTRLDANGSPWGPNVDAFLVDGYFWVQAPRLAEEFGPREYLPGKDEHMVSFQANVSDNAYRIQIADTRLDTLRILVSSEMVDLSKNISVEVNGELRFLGRVKPDPARMLRIAREQADPRFLFENWVDIPLHQD